LSHGRWHTKHTVHHIHMDNSPMDINNAYFHADGRHTHMSALSQPRLTLAETMTMACVQM